MKTHALSIAVVLAALLACKKKEAPAPTPVVTTPTTATAAEPPVDTWKSFKSEEGKFEIRAPSAMTSESDPTDTAAGDLDMHLFTAKQSATAFQVAYTDMPGKIVKAAGPKKLLKGGEEGAMKSMNATSTTSSEIKVEGHPGREYTTSTTVEGIELDYYGRAFLVKNRLYQIQVIGPKGRVSDADRKKFVDSFQLLK
jgi:hypothetical protein